MAVRTKNKIYAEVSSEETVLVSSDLMTGKYVISGGNRTVKTFNPGPKRIMITDAQGYASSFGYNQPNKAVGIDNTGRLALFDRVSNTPPAGRQLIVEVLGSTNPAAILNQMSLLLDGNHWYEIEVIGAGGGGGGGIGMNYSDASFLSGSNGGDGGRYKCLFLLRVNAMAHFYAGNSGGAADAIVWQYDSYNSPLIPGGKNTGGAGGRQINVMYAGSGNDGLDDSLDSTGKEGGLGIESGASGGNTYIDFGIGVGSSGGGANGPYGGNGGNSIYLNEGIYDTRAGGAGGAGGGLGRGGGGGGSQFPSVGYGGGGGGSGIVRYINNTYDYTYSGGGGGGGGSSVFTCADILIVAGGGGGGAGAGFGGIKAITEGGRGTNNHNDVVGGGGSGGIGGQGVNTDLPWSYDKTNCKGTNGGRGLIRLWRCI